MANELLNFYNLDPDDDLEESVRIALMFTKEINEATRAYMEMLQLTIDPDRQSPEEMSRLMEDTINAALVTGLRAYRTWIDSAGVDVRSVEASSGKDIPPVNFYRNARWPM